jgi:hypothetical protein
VGVAIYLTIPDIVESVELLSVSAGPDGVTFAASMAVSDTAVRLMRAAANGELIPLVVLTMETQIIALDSVYVTDATQTAGERPLVELTFAAQAARVV